MTNRLQNSLLFMTFMSLCQVVAATEIHQHKSKQIAEGMKIPQIELTVFADVMDGVNIHVDVVNYRLNAPDTVKDPSGDATILEGHAHVFINSEKKRRLYGQDMHIPKSWLKPGLNQIAVSLNSHQHENWVYNNQNIVSSVYIDLAKTPILEHTFSSQPILTPQE